MNNTLYAVGVKYDNGAKWGEEPYDYGSYEWGVYETKEDAEKAVQRIFDMAKAKNKDFKKLSDTSFEFNGYTVELRIYESILGDYVLDLEDSYWGRC